MLFVDCPATEGELELFKVLVRGRLPAADWDEVLASMLARSSGLANLRDLYLVVPDIREPLGTPGELAVHAARLLLRGLKT